MAIVQNMWLKKSKKRLGGTVLYQAMEQTRQRELAVSVSNPRTQAQMTQRVKWANLVNMYRVNRSWMKYAFETKSPQQSEYNKFMSVNVTASNIYLTKQLAGMGACIVAPYVITQGSIMPVEVTANTGSWSSNLYLTENFTLTQATTIAEFTQALLANNPALREGDQLSFIRLTQMSNTDTGAPYVIVRRYEILLKASDTGLVKDYLPLDYISVIASQPLPCLGVLDSGLSGGFALVISRTIGGKTYVSTQRIIVANNAAMIAAYSSNTALSNAISSYGESSEAFLSSNTAEGAQAVPVALSVLSITKGSTTSATGTQVSVNNWNHGEALTVNFNAPIEAATQVGAVVISSGTSYPCTAVVDNNRVQLTLPANFPDAQEAYLQRVTVTLDGVSYNGVFNVPTGGDDGGGDAD